MESEVWWVYPNTWTRSVTPRWARWCCQQHEPSWSGDARRAMKIVVTPA